MGLTETLLHRWQEEHEATLRVLRALPEEHRNWRPHDLSTPLGELARHLVASQRGFLYRLLGREVPRLAMPPRLADLVGISEDFHREGVEALQNWTEAEWLEEVEFAGRRRRRLDAFLEMLGHESHHRGQLTVYLRLLEVPVPSTYGPTASMPQPP